MSPAPRQHDARAAAATWDARLRSHCCSDADRGAFRAWCEEDPQHEEAFVRLQQALSTLRRAGEHPQVRALRELASLAERRAAERRRLSSAGLAAGVLGAAIVITGIMTAPGAFTHTASAPDASFITASNERRTVALPDGSSMTLNAATRINTEWSAKGRYIRLVTGQALFRVAKDRTRPFVVTVADRTVTASGTAFDVKLAGNEVQVTLVEGRVAVRGLGKAAGQPLFELSPREQLVAAAGEVPRVRTVDVASATGWAEGQVYFTDEPLPAAVADMNQYSDEKIVVGDSSLAHYRVNGMFRAGNQVGFASALAAYYPIDVLRDDDGRIVLQPRSGKTPAEP